MAEQDAGDLRPAGGGGTWSWGDGLVESREIGKMGPRQDVEAPGLVTGMMRPSDDWQRAASARDAEEDSRGRSGDVQ